MENRHFYQNINPNASLGQEASQQANPLYKQRENQSSQQSQQSYPMFNPLFRPISYFPPKSDNRQDNIAPVRTDNGAKVFSLFETARMPPNFMSQSQQEQRQEVNKEPLSYNPYFYQRQQQQMIESQTNQQPHYNQSSKPIGYQQQFQQVQDSNFQLLKEFERNMNPQSAYRTEGGERVFSLMCTPCQEFSFQDNFQPNKFNQSNREYENYYLEEGMQGQNSNAYQPAYLNEIQGKSANYKESNDQYLGIQLQSYSKEKSQTSQKDLKQGAKISNIQTEKQEEIKQNKKEKASGLNKSQLKDQNKFIYQQIKQMHDQISKQIQDLEQQRQKFQNIMDILLVQDQSLEQDVQTEKGGNATENNEDQAEQFQNYQSQQGQLKESSQLQNHQNQTEKEFSTQNLSEAESLAQNQQLSQSNKSVKELNSGIQSVKEDTKDLTAITQTKSESEALQKHEQMNNQ